METQNEQIDPSLDTSSQQDTSVSQQSDSQAAAGAGVQSQSAESIQGDVIATEAALEQPQEHKDQETTQVDQSASQVVENADDNISADKPRVDASAADQTQEQAQTNQPIVIGSEPVQIDVKEGDVLKINTTGSAPVIEKLSADTVKQEDASVIDPANIATGVVNTTGIAFLDRSDAVPNQALKTISDIFGDVESDDAYKISQLEVSGKLVTRTLIGTLRRIIKNTAPGRPLDEKSMTIYQIELLNSIEAILKADYEDFKEAWGTFITFFVIAEKKHKEKKYTALHERYILRGLHHWTKGTESSMALAQLISLARLSIDPKLRGKALTREVAFDSLGKGYLDEEARQQLIKFYGV